MSSISTTTSKRILHLITQATQAIEQGNTNVRVSEAGAAALSPAFVPARSSTLSQGEADTALKNSQGTSSIQRPGEAAPGDTEMREVCQAFNRMAEAICRRDRERLHFMAAAAHDLNNPLMVISGAARMLGESDVPLHERRLCLERLQRNVVALQYIVAELTDKVQAQAGQLRLHFDHLDLTDLARSVSCDFAASVSSHPLRFEGDGVCPVLGDRQRLSRMLLNLLSNAAKYSESGNEITVSVWRRGNQAILSVQDHGVGVSAADTERMFLPFRRLDHTSGMADGTGIGLVSVQKIAEAHGAEIHVQGAPRQGTTVQVWFKILEDAPTG